jgi:uridine kinase
MNILEAYLKKYGQFIVLILGLPCSNKSELARVLSEDIGLPKININNYIKSDSYIEKEVENIKFKIYEHPENYNWDKLNEDVNKKKKDGLVLYGNFIDKSKIDFDIDFVYFINLNTNLCKTLLLEKKLLQYPDDEEKIKIYFKDIFNPIYEDIKQELKINKFFNIKESSVFGEIYDDLFDSLMSGINNKLK